MTPFGSIFWRFLLLGCTSFGGPAAHLGYFRSLFVERQRWLDDAAFARLVALSQFLPGPASSQVGFAIGLKRGGLAGGCAAFLGFTAPSFLLMYGLAVADATLTTSTWFQGVLHGLKLLAVVVVADATLKMFETFCRDRLTTGLCVVTAASLLALPGLLAQFGALCLAAAAGAWLIRTGAEERRPGRFRALPLLLFLALLLGLPLASGVSSQVALASDFYLSGSFVFGGGHVVLPLLQNTLGGAVPTDRFLLGYAAAQAIPGPMFSLAGFLGADMAPGNALASSLTGALVATLAIFLPGFLLVIAVLEGWERLTSLPRIAGAAAGLNAAVVGLLLAALYRPVFVSAVHAPLDMTVVILGMFLLRGLRLPVLLLVGLGALTGLGLQQLA